MCVRVPWTLWTLEASRARPPAQALVRLGAFVRHPPAPSDVVCLGPRSGSCFAFLLDIARCFGLVPGDPTWVRIGPDLALGVASSLPLTVQGRMTKYTSGKTRGTSVEIMYLRLSSS